MATTSVAVYSSRRWVVRRRLNAMFAAFLLVTITGCMGYVPGRQSYWDAKLKDMCKADAGTTVYEQVALSEEEYRRLGGYAGTIHTPNETAAPAMYPFVTRWTESVLNEKHPRVVRREIFYVRQSDAKILAKTITYSRVGGDAPSFGHPTIFACPNPEERMAALRTVFKVQRDDK